MNGVPGREAQAVADHDPQDRDHAGGAQTLRHDREHVLRAHQAAVEQRQAGQGHEQDQGGADHHPGVVTGAGASDLRLFRDARAVVDVRLEIAESLFDRLGVEGGGSRGSGGRRRCGRRRLGALRVRKPRQGRGEHSEHGERQQKYAFCETLPGAHCERFYDIAQHHWSPWDDGPPARYRATGCGSVSLFHAPTSPGHQKCLYVHMI